MNRYSIIKEKRRREIVLLRGRGCAYKACTFCDYHTDGCADEAAAFLCNAEALSCVTGEFGELEVINSGSVFELDGRTLGLIKDICESKGIHTLHFESHYMYRSRIADLRRFFGGISLKLKLGLESFDYDLRENVLKKGIKERDPAVISAGFDEANLLFGLTGQTEESMLLDIGLGLKYFERICVNIMCANTTAVVPDGEVISIFKERIYPRYADDPRVDILLNNTDFGVGE